MDEKALLEAIRGIVREEVQAETSPIKADIAELKHDVKKLTDTAAKIEGVYGQKINGMFESIVGTGEKFSRLDLVESKVENNEHRIFAIEEKLKQA